MVNRSRFFRVFKKWLKENRSKFLYVIPYIACVDKNSFLVYFHGYKHFVVIGARTDGEFSAWSRFDVPSTHKDFADYGPQSSDWIGDFDTSIEYCSIRGFYNSLIIEDHVYFKTKEEFWIKSSFEPLLEWVNEKLNPKMCMVMYAGHTKFISVDDVDKIKKDEVVHKFNLISL